jgi:hypothetical protein
LWDPDNGCRDHDVALLGAFSDSVTNKLMQLNLQVDISNIDNQDTVSFRIDYPYDDCTDFFCYYHYEDIPATDNLNDWGETDVNSWKITDFGDTTHKSIFNHKYGLMRTNPVDGSVTSRIDGLFWMYDDYKMKTAISTIVNDDGNTLAVVTSQIIPYTKLYEAEYFQFTNGLNDYYGSNLHAKQGYILNQSDCPSANNHINSGERFQECDVKIATKIFPYYLIIEVNAFTNECNGFSVNDVKKLDMIPHKSNHYEMNLADYDYSNEPNKGNVKVIPIKVLHATELSLYVNMNDTCLLPSENNNDI